MFTVMQIIAIRDIIQPPDRDEFNDVYIVYELMDTDLHQIIKSNQPLTEDHCQVWVLVSPFVHKWLITEFSFITKIRWVLVPYNITHPTLVSHAA